LTSPLLYGIIQKTGKCILNYYPNNQTESKNILAMPRVKRWETVLPKHLVTPYAELAGEIADRIADTVQVSLDEGDKPLTELIGDTSMAMVMKQISEGTISGAAAFTFLAQMAKTKTQNPVQKTENKNLNFTRSIMEIVEGNPEALQRAERLAEENRARVIERHKTDNILRLKPLQSSAFTEDKGDEPEEIKELRKSNANT